MNTLKSITLEEDENTGFIHLYKEGIFWKAYNHSAFLLCTQVRKLKVNQRVTKSCGDNVVFYVGFPVVYQERTLPATLTIITASDTRLTLAAPQKFDAKAYAVWCSEFKVKPSNVDYTNLSDSNQGANSVKEALVIDAINNFDLANSTPLDALNLVNKLQQLLLSH